MDSAGFSVADRRPPSGLFDGKVGSGSGGPLTDGSCVVSVTGAVMISPNSSTAMATAMAGGGGRRPQPVCWGDGGGPDGGLLHSDPYGHPLTDGSRSTCSPAAGASTVAQSGDGGTFGQGASSLGELVTSPAALEIISPSAAAEGGTACSTAMMDDDSPAHSLPLQVQPMAEVEMISSPPGDFCMGDVDGLASARNPLSAPKFCTPGVRRFASAIFPSSATAGHVQDSLQSGHAGLGAAWQRPSKVALPPVDELGVYSVDGATALLDPVEVEATAKRFEAALVGRMFGRRIPFGVLSGELRRRWAAYGNTRIVTLSGDCFVCFFDCIESRDEALLGGPWVIFGQVLGVDRWTPSFSLKSTASFSTPVWVRMPNLPLYCWSPRNLARIAALVGQPLWIDGATADLERGSYARACIRIDLSQPLKSGVWVDGPHGKFFQSLEYEGLSVFCCRCSQVGHKATACSRPSTSSTPKGGRSTVMGGSCGVDPPSSPSQVGSPSTVQHAPVPSSSLPASPVAGLDTFDDKGVGPWMIVARRRRNNLSGPHGGGRPPRHVVQQASGLGQSILGPFGGASTGSERCPAMHSGRSSTPSQVMDGMHSPVLQLDPHGRSPSGSSVDVQAVPIRDPDGPTLFGFSALPREDAGNDPISSVAKPRSRGDKIRGAKKEKMICELGPLAPGSRKRRKAQSTTGGGDASPSPTP